MFTPALLPTPTNRLALVQVAASRSAHQAAHQAIFDLAVRLSLAGPLRVVDAGGLFDLYSLTHAVRQRSDSALALRHVLQSIRLTRADSCQPLLAVLARLPSDPTPTLVIDLLAPFYMLNGSPAECARLLSACLIHLRRLSQAAPVVVTGQVPGPDSIARLPLLEMLQRAATCVMEVNRSLPL